MTRVSIVLFTAQKNTILVAMISIEKILSFLTLLFTCTNCYDFLTHVSDECKNDVSPFIYDNLGGKLNADPLTMGIKPADDTLLNELSTVFNGNVNCS